MFFKIALIAAIGFLYSLVNHVLTQMLRCFGATNKQYDTAWYDDTQMPLTYFTIVSILDFGLIFIIRDAKVHLSSLYSHRLLATPPFKHCHVATLRYKAQQRKAIVVHVRPTSNTLTPAVHDYGSTAAVYIMSVWIKVLHPTQQKTRSF